MRIMEFFLFSFLIFTINADQGGRNIYRDKFSDLLLVINFNHPYYSNIQFLKDLYSPFFEHIVFYGEKPDPEVFDISTHHGFFLSDVLQDVLTRFPQYRGYFILQDDCVINFWNYISLDPDKIWFAIKSNNYINRNDIFYSIINFDGTNVSGREKWWWSTLLNGHTMFEAVRSVYVNLLPIDLEFLQENIGKNNVAGQFCDFFYIPNRFRESVLRLCPIFKNVFCEIAIPNMLCCLDKIGNWEHLKMCWGFNWRTLTKTNYPSQVSWVHPIKFSDQENRRIVTEVFARYG